MGCKAICFCLSHLARDCNGELMFGGAAHGGITETLKGFLTTWVKTAKFPVVRGWQRKSLGSGKSLVLIYYLICQLFSPRFHMLWDQETTSLPSCAATSTSMILSGCWDVMNISGGPTPVVAVTLSVCLTHHAYKWNTDDYLLLSDVIKC